MKKKSIMIDILLISIGGLIAIGVSVRTVLQNEKQKSELQEKQLELIEAQKLIIQKQDLLVTSQERYSAELKEKSDEVIRLQKILQEKSETQLKEISNLKNPIPENLEVNFLATLKLSKKEFEEIWAIDKEVYNQFKNLLPINISKSNESFDKINSLKNVMFRLIIKFEEGEKSWTVILDRAPLPLLGYNVPNTSNTFILYLNEEKSQICFQGLMLQTNKISSNYKSPSLLDFKNSKVTISYSFSYPATYQVGGISSNNYVDNNKSYIILNLESLSLEHKNYSIKIEDLKQIDPRIYEGFWKNYK